MDNCSSAKQSHIAKYKQAIRILKKYRYIYELSCYGGEQPNLIAEPMDITSQNLIRKELQNAGYFVLGENKFVIRLLD